MQATFNLKNVEDLQRLEQYIAQLPNKAEKVMNDYLHNKAGNDVIRDIKSHMPVGSRDKSNYKRGQPKTHAKISDSMETKPINLGFIVKTTNPFWYLQFPALGTGNSYRNVPDQFMEQGIDKAIPKIVDDLTELLIEEINKGGN